MSSIRPSLDRFQGVLVGALIGDCLGAPYEGMAFGRGIPIERIRDATSKRSDMAAKAKGSMRYTDDSAMTKSICKSLVHCGKFDSVDMANRFTKSFFKDPNRGYGGGVRDVFEAWAKQGINYKNVFQPSAKQFDGSGSYGNGGAMRVSPVALFAKSLDECISLAKQSALLTHSNASGYNGAILQAVAVFKSVHHSKNEEKLDWKVFLNELREVMREVEVDLLASSNVESSNKEKDEDDGGCPIDKLYMWTRSKSFTYTKQLDKVEELLETHFKQPTEDDMELVFKHIGRDVSAQQAVPAAIYCFLRMLETGCEETMYYAISLGGDTDTIASMCLAMAGGYYGYESLPDNWKYICEYQEKMKGFAIKLCNLHKE